MPIIPSDKIYIIKNNTNIPVGAQVVFGGPGISFADVDSLIIDYYFPQVVFLS